MEASSPKSNEQKVQMRKLLQAEAITPSFPSVPPTLPPTILRPLVPINWMIYEAPLLEWNIDDPVVSYWLTFNANLLSLEAVAVNLFGDLPVAGLMAPNLDLFGGRGLNPLDFEGIEAGAVLAQLSAWFEFEFFDFSGNLPFLKINIWEKFGFEDLGLPENFSDHYTVPYEGPGVVEVNLIEDSFVNWLRNLDLSWLARDLTPGFYGFDFRSF